MKLKSKIHLALAFLFLGLLVCSCKKTNSPAPPPAPPPTVPVQISAVSPLEGPGGTTVTIRGSGFSDTSGLDSVYFNGKAAAITSASDSILQVTVPLTAGTGNVSVTVKGQTVSGPSFTYDYQGVVTTYAGNASVPAGAANGNGTHATFNEPWGIAVDGGGDLYVADNGNNKVRLITPDKTVSTLVTLKGSPAGLALDGKGSLFVSQFSTPMSIIQVSLSPVDTFTLSGNGTEGYQNSPPHPSAEFDLPMGLGIDKDGNVFVAEYGNDVIRLVTPAGETSTFAGSQNNNGAQNGAANFATFRNLTDLVFDAAGNCYVADGSNFMIRKITPDGAVSTLAGNGKPSLTDGTGAGAGFGYLTGITVDSKGNLYVSDQTNNAIRMITPAGAVTTIAGSGKQGAVDGIGPAASFKYLLGIACDKNGTLWVADGGNNTIRKITLQ